MYIEAQPITRSAEALLALRRVRAQSRRTVICACIRKLRVRRLVYVCVYASSFASHSHVTSAHTFSFDLVRFRAKLVLHIRREKDRKRDR